MGVEEIITRKFFYGLQNPGGLGRDPRSLLGSIITTNRQDLPRKAFKCDVNTAAAAGSGFDVFFFFLQFLFPVSLHARSTCAIDLAECR